VVFDVNHSPQRLLVFFPSLVFGWLRLRTGSLLPGIFFHALCNGVEELVRTSP
jgi:membrane protease YdiL (CAAX protease family)